MPGLPSDAPHPEAAAAWLAFIRSANALGIFRSIRVQALHRWLMERNALSSGVLFQPLRLMPASCF
jgi:hypothetical protein